ncbi:MAG: hypothetical protein FJ051_06260, partial [Cyanobacteria bacterium M_surface_9_m1_291]|nr:hypothetical protein [Cyanobacteria bacterium M_surface_9_m1_291]
MAKRPKRLKTLLLRLAPYGIAALVLRGLELSQVLEGVNLLAYDLITTLRPAPSVRRQRKLVRRRHENWSTPWSTPGRTTRTAQGRHLWSRWFWRRRC